jgi:hypothetical protein
MGLFWSDSKPSVSKTEFQEKIIPHLEANDWTHEHKELVKMVFAGSLNESDSQSGIDKTEIENGINILKKSGKISSSKLEDLKKHMLDCAR